MQPSLNKLLGSFRHIAGTLRLRWITLRAWIWRRCLLRTTVIAVTGSVGKTSTKELLVKVLSDHAPTAFSPGNWHGYASAGSARALLATRPHHRFLVVEVGIERAGELRRMTAMLKPDIALVLEVKKLHSKVFRDIESIAKEKSELVRPLRGAALVILNFDNPFVRDMRCQTRAKTIGFGMTADSTVKLERVESGWPERMLCEIRAPSGPLTIRTQFLGAHWKIPVLATIAVAEALNLPVDRTAQLITQVPPFWARLQPIVLPGSGAVILRDEFNGALDTFHAALSVLETAKARRRIVLFSDFSDSSRSNRDRASQLGRMAAKVADVAGFVGSYGERSRSAAIRAGMSELHAMSFPDLSHATDFLRNNLQSGDLVLIKGRANHHLSRIYLGLLGTVRCEREICGMKILCDTCPSLGFHWTPDLEGLMAPPGSYA